MMRVAVVGAGAIGGFLAGALARAGVPVAVVARGAHAAAIRERALTVESDLGNFTTTVEVGDDLRMLGDFDALLLTFKAHQWPELIEQLAPFAAKDTRLVTLQNGVPFWYVREPPLRRVDPDGTIGRLFPDRRVIGCVVTVSGEIVAPGHVRQSGGLRYVFGSPAGGLDERLTDLVALFTRAGLSPERDPNVREAIWLKLVNNVGLNAASVLYRATIKQLLEDPARRSRVRDLMIETLGVGRAMGVVGDVDVDARLAYASRLQDVKTSMLQDYERHRPLEVDPILGAAIELAERYGIEVPAIRRAYGDLRRLAADGGS